MYISLWCLRLPRPRANVKARIAASMALIFGTETGFVEVKMFNEMKADAGPAHGLKGPGRALDDKATCK